MGRFTQKTGAAWLAALCMAGAQSASAQATYALGPWLPVTNIAVQAGGGSGDTVMLNWDDFRNLAGVQVYASPTLEGADWQPVNGPALRLKALGQVSGHDYFDLATVEATLAKETPQHFYRVRAVRGPYTPSGTRVLPDGTVIINADPDGSVTINPDGTVPVGPGDVIFIPPHGTPYTVPESGTYIPGPPPKVVLGAVPAQTEVLLPPDVWGGASAWLKIDLMTGEAARYETLSLKDQIALTTDIGHITTNLWLRWINPGTFTMGSPTNEANRNVSREARHKVTLTKGFWAGVFPVTQWQYDLVCSGFSTLYIDKNTNAAHRADWKPMIYVSYDNLRTDAINAGVSTTAKDAVAEASFMGLLAKKVRECALNSEDVKRIAFDLPTEAQWEYACRAGTTGTYSDDSNDIVTAPAGSGPETHLNALGRYIANQKDGAGGASGTAYHSENLTRPGSYAPNRAGLYDMHGNVWEWCLDVMQDNVTGLAADPVVASPGTDRVLRGGKWNGDARSSRSANRGYYIPDDSGVDIGFRVAGAPAE